jgi:2-polyprenyl-6-methoxyphenol hydroxylase-like FAD-dependent oxidoreductase
VDLAALAVAVQYDPRRETPLAVVPAYRDRHLTTWPALYQWLRDRVAHTPGIHIAEGRGVRIVKDEGESVLLQLDDGSTLQAEAVIGADGYRSTLRRTIAPDAPHARYAGYLVWRGLVDEQRLQRPVDLSSDSGLWIDLVDGQRLVAAVLPGRNGSLAVGRRQVTFAWFDAHQAPLLRQHGCLTADGHIVGTLGRQMIDEDTRTTLAARIPRLWPVEWQEAVTLGIHSAQSLSGAPIAEYRPTRLALGRLAVVGDAAHSMSPMTGSGYAAGVEDATVLATLLAERAPDTHVAQVLAHYEAMRLPYVRGLVSHSMGLSANYVRYANAHPPQGPAPA